jgi:hypothetical protein
MAAANTYVSIASQTLSSAAATVTFSSIPATYTDLVLIISAMTASQDIKMNFNSDTSTNYSFTFLIGTGSSAISNRGSSQTFMLLDSYGYPQSTTPNASITNIQNYSNTTTYKTCLTRSSNGATGTDAVVNLWRSTSAITTILLQVYNSTNFAIGSTFTLYGILAA